jgi:GNAT superfamily N-acetyltransferase
MTVLIRDAVAGDLDEVVAVFLACWRGSYAAVLPPALVERMTDAQAHELWSAAFGRQGGRMLVAESADDGRVLGVTRVSFDEWGSEGVADDRVGTVESLYVSPAAQGQGVGRRLLDAAVAALAEVGATTARLWVFEQNLPSREFYRLQGWAEDGAHRVQDAFGEPELRLARGIAPDLRRVQDAFGEPELRLARRITPDGEAR